MKEKVEFSFFSVLSVRFHLAIKYFLNKVCPLINPCHIVLYHLVYLSLVLVS